MLEVSERDIDLPMLEGLDQELAQTSGFEQELTSLIDTGAAIESYGLNRTAYSMLDKAGLLAGTSFDAIGMESLGRGEGPDSVESKMALEAIGQKITDNAVRWSAKIVQFVKDASEKLVSALDHVWAKVSEQADKLAHKSWNASKAAAAYAKAHPYKTMAIAATAALTIAGIVAYIASQVTGPYANETALSTFMFAVKKKVDAVHWPFGTITTTATVDGKSIKCVIDTVKNSDIPGKSLVELGYNQSATMSLSGRLSQIMTALKKSLYLLGLNMAHFMDKGVNVVNKTLNHATMEVVKATHKAAFHTERMTGSKVAGETVRFVGIFAYLFALRMLIQLVVVLVISVIIKLFSMTYNLFKTIGNAVVDTFVPAY